MFAMTKDAKRDFVETIDTVSDAADDGTTHQLTKGGWRKFYMRHDYVVLDCGAVIDLDPQGVDREIWYDDETADPLGESDASRLAGFLSHNHRVHDCGFGGVSDYMRHVHVRRDGDGSVLSADSDWSDPCAIKVTYDPSRNYGDAWTWFDRGHGSERVSRLERQGFVTVALSPAEVAQLADYAERRNADYDRRLRGYFRRYGDKVCSHGFWAER